MADGFGTKLGNINRGKIRMNYMNVKHLVQLYDIIGAMDYIGYTLYTKWFLK